jgi:NADH-quinone oxidoreductase subunit C
MALTYEKITEKLTTTFGSDILLIEEPYKMLTITVNKEKIVDIVRYLKEDAELQFIFLTDLTGVHYPDDPTGEKLGAIYHLHNLVDNVRIRIRALFPKEFPTIDSLTVLYSGANWMERETYDFFGIIFKNHPNLKRILNVDDMDYFPMRKEYALEDPTREDKEDKFFGR